MANTPDLLSHAVFQYENVIRLERWIVVPVRIDGNHGQANLFCENPDRRLLIYFLPNGRWRRGGRR
jgi:hypothetical protein